MMRKIWILFLCALYFPSFAHAPHDVISDLLLFHEKGQELCYVVSRASLYKKIGHNSYKRVVRGLDNSTFLGELSLSIDGKKMFLTSEGNGVYVSTDFGNSWRRSNTGLDNHELHLIESSEFQPGLILTSGLNGGLYYSINKGQSWQECMDFKNKQIIAICETSDGFYISDNLNTIFLLDPQTLAAKKIHQLERVQGGINAMAAIDPASNQKNILIATDEGAFLLNPADGYGVQAIKGIPRGKIMDIRTSIPQDSGSKIYMLHGYKGFYVSTDDGNTFQRESKGLSTDPQADLYNVPDFRKIKAFTSEDSENLFICGFDGLFRRKADGGWEQEHTLSESLIVGLDVSPGVSDDPLIAALTYLNGPVISTDKGRTWDKDYTGSIITENLLSEGKMRNLDVVVSGNSAELWFSTRTNLHKLKVGEKSWEVHPLCRENKIAKKLGAIRKRKSLNVHPGCYGSHRIFRIDHSDDILICSKKGDVVIYHPKDGRITTLVHLNIPLTSIDISPTFLQDSLFIVGSADQGLFVLKNREMLFRYDSIGNHITAALSPSFSQDSMIFVGSTRGFFKVKSGRFQAEKPDTSINGYVISLALSPDFRNDGTILLTQKGRGLFKSVNGGDSFYRIEDPGIQYEEFGPVPFFPPNAGAIKFSGNYAMDATIYAYSGESIFASEDAGMKWNELPGVKLDYPNQTLTFLRGVYYEFTGIIKILFLLGGLVLLTVLVYKLRKNRIAYQGSSRPSN